MIIRVSRTDDGRFIARSGADFVVSNTARSAQAKLGRFLKKNGPSNQIRYARPLVNTVWHICGQKHVHAARV